MEKQSGKKQEKKGWLKLLGPTYVPRIFNFGKQEIRQVRREYCKDAVNVSFFLSLVVLASNARA